MPLSNPFSRKPAAPPDAYLREKLAESIRIDEGWRAYCYDDTLGYRTIGYGFLVDQRKGGGLPPDIGELWLDKLVTARWDELHQRAPWLSSQPDDVRLALANMAYQMGVSGVLNFRKMCAALLVGDRDAAAKEAMNSKWALQTPRRAARIAAMIRGQS